MKADIAVAYDSLTGVKEDALRELFSFCGVPFPQGRFVESPALEYYSKKEADIFPVWNSGVFAMRSSLADRFCATWMRLLTSSYEHFKHRSWSFYLEQVCFSVAVHDLGLSYCVMPPGYNFICTPRAPFLQSWDRNSVVIEHYAGDNSVPSLSIIAIAPDLPE